MSLLKKLKQKKYRKINRVRARQLSRGEKLRVSVFRSLNHVSAQIIDDNKGQTLVSASSLNLQMVQGSKSIIARQVGLELGKMAIAMNIKEVFFDRGGYLYHGRIKSLADGLRESGLKF